jgi:hypothetical protein
MKNKDIHSQDCSIIDEFVGAGAASSNGATPLKSTGSIGCSILTEFIAQGEPSKRELQNGQKTESSPSQGCETISTFLDEGFIPMAAVRQPD